ncbi:GTP-binding protein [Elasticomyces elasticus]|nr:GTP-binding protein [Elasticomyces elasticus]KAK4996463.1 GTP-binding protein [Elasticomyces elasticus]
MAPQQKQRKMAIVGSRSVGKSSLTVQYVDGHFVDSYYPTIENTFSKVINYKNQDFAVEIIDTAGQGADEVPICIVGNKCDLRPEQRQVKKEDGHKLAAQLKCSWTEASARIDENVAKAFEMMLGEIEKGQEAGQPKEGGKCVVM